MEAFDYYAPRSVSAFPLRTGSSQGTPGQDTDVCQNGGGAVRAPEPTGRIVYRNGEGTNASVLEGRALVRLTFVDDAVRRLCTTQEALRCAFGELWEMVRFCLAVLDKAETLAEVAAFAAVTVRQVVGDVVEFVVAHGSAEVRVCAIGDHLVAATSAPKLSEIVAVSIVSVSAVPAVVGA